MAYELKQINLIRSQDDWREYCKAFEASRGLLSVSWGVGPVKYPLSVCSYAVDTTKVVTCYFYPENAAELLNAAGFYVANVNAQTTTEPAAPVNVLPLQSEFNLGIAANQLSIVQTLIQRKLITEDAYEKRLISNRAVVDRWHTEDRQHLVNNVEGSAIVLGGLLGDGEK